MSDCINQFDADIFNSCWRKDTESYYSGGGENGNVNVYQFSD